MNSGELNTFTGRLIGDPKATRWTATKKKDAHNRAQIEFVLDTECLVDSSTDSIVSGTYEYSLPSTLLLMKRVTVNGLDLRRRSRGFIDSYTADDWSDDTGTPKYYYVDADPDNKKIRLYPIPQDADAGTNNLVMEFIKIPTELDATSDIPLGGHTLLVPYHKALCYKAAAELLSTEITPANLEKIKYYESEYYKTVDRCIGIWRANTQDMPMRMRGGRVHAEISQ